MNGEFAVQVARFCGSVGERADAVLQRTVMELATGIVNDTPVDTGLLRANWQFSASGIPATSNITPDPSGVNTLAEIQSGVRTLKAGGVCYLVNNLVYAYIVEYGLFPNPGQAHYDARLKAKVVKTTPEGYSLKAPEGMVRRNIQKLEARMDAVVAEAAGGAK